MQDCFLCHGLAAVLQLIEGQRPASLPLALHMSCIQQAFHCSRHETIMRMPGCLIGKAPTCLVETLTRRLTESASTTVLSNPVCSMYVGGRDFVLRTHVQRSVLDSYCTVINTRTNNNAAIGLAHIRIRVLRSEAHACQVVLSTHEEARAAGFHFHLQGARQKSLGTKSLAVPGKLCCSLKQQWQMKFLCCYYCSVTNHPCTTRRSWHTIHVIGQACGSWQNASLPSSAGTIIIMS